MPAFQHGAALSDQSPHALLAAQGGTFFDAIFGPFGSAPKNAKNSGVAAKVHGIIAPFAGCNHPSIQVQYLRQLCLVKANLVEATDQRKRRYYGAQLALLPLPTRRLTGGISVRASRSAINSPTFLRNDSISHCMISRLCVAGSKSSRHGVP